MGISNLYQMTKFYTSLNWNQLQTKQVENIVLKRKYWFSSILSFSYNVLKSPFCQGH